MKTETCHIILKHWNLHFIATLLTAIIKHIPSNHQGFSHEIPKKIAGRYRTQSVFTYLHSWIWKFKRLAFYCFCSMSLPLSPCQVPAQSRLITTLKRIFRSQIAPPSSKKPTAPNLPVAMPRTRPNRFAPIFLAELHFDSPQAPETRSSVSFYHHSFGIGRKQHRWNGWKYCRKFPKRNQKKPPTFQAETW